LYRLGHTFVLSDGKSALQLAEDEGQSDIIVALYAAGACKCDDPPFPVDFAFSQHRIVCAGPA
jgi:hypothetical protein